MSRLKLTGSASAAGTAMIHSNAAFKLIAVHPDCMLNTSPVRDPLVDGKCRSTISCHRLPIIMSLGTGSQQRPCRTPSGIPRTSPHRTATPPHMMVRDRSDSERFLLPLGPLDGPRYFPLGQRATDASQSGYDSTAKLFSARFRGRRICPTAKSRL